MAYFLLLLGYVLQYLPKKGVLESTAEKKTVTEQHLELSPRPKKETITSKSTSGLTDITWSSSGSDLSDEDKTLFKPQRDNGHGSRIERFCNKNILCPEDGASEDEPQFIDWEIDSDREDSSECKEFEDDESAVEISDCASCVSSPSLTSEEKLSEYPKASSTEILEYSSDSEKEDDLENVLVIDSESSHEYRMDFGSDGRQVMERLKNPRVESTETSLNTPQKQTKFPRTPENSTKKQQLLRGGLAERLNGLQNRERSAISLWRHQCVSYQKTLSGRKSGILTVKILELHEECTIQVAMCEQLAGLQADSPSQGEAPGTGLKVLFTKETAHYLRGHPQDIVHIYPPWQKLIIPNGSCPVILNTYFCQKTVAKEDSKTTHEMHCWDTPLPRRHITLAQMFRFKSPTNNSPESQVMCSGLTTMGTDCTHGDKEAKQHFPAQAPLRDSLLDAIESQGAATWPGGGVRVVVQRVYSLPCRCQQGGSDPPRVRICLLVQDACGMFGEVYSEGTILKDRRLEGKSCRLAGMKVLQKATRGSKDLGCSRCITSHAEGSITLFMNCQQFLETTVKTLDSDFSWTPGIFSLIDIMWPPVIPLKAPGHGQAYEEVKTHLPPPSFCYILTAHPNLGQIDIIEEDPISKLYQPPIPHSLREILQTGDLGTRCSFYARVIYRSPQLNSLLLLERREIWLMVTDVTLQMQDENNSGLPKTIPVFVASSCVLDPEVLEALTEAAPHSFLFKDALRDQGRIVCVERTVLLLQKPLLGVASGARSCELTGPVKLDELDSVTQVNSICSVRGAVVGVDESTAFSWPTCDLCGNERLRQSPEDSSSCKRKEPGFVLSSFIISPEKKEKLRANMNKGTFSCGDCSRVVTFPLLRRHLQVFLDCPSRPQCTVRVKTHEVKSVLGKEVGLLNCLVQSITTHPTSCVGLEEIELLSTGRASWEHRQLPKDL